MIRLRRSRYFIHTCTNVGGHRFDRMFYATDRTTDSVSFCNRVSCIFTNYGRCGCVTRGIEKMRNWSRMTMYGYAFNVILWQSFDGTLFVCGFGESRTFSHYLRMRDCS